MALVPALSTLWQQPQDIWHDIAERRPQFSFAHSAPGFGSVQQSFHRSAQAAFERLSHVMSPYELNPLDINPLRNVLETHIDFEKLKSQSRFKLFIAATSVATGKSRIFRNHDLSIEVVLASCCLPTLFKAIEIDGHYYWDGGYSANPDLKTMVRESHTGDTIIVLLNPLTDTRQPRTSAEISDSINRITFNQPFLSECDYIRLYRQHANFRLFSPSNRRMINHRFHAILSGRHTEQLAPGSKSNPDLEMLLGLFRSGREETEHWISQNRKQVGRSSTFEVFR
ncbi:MAG: patatin-like phospholipase family protein [Desulfobulbia bacterium]